MASTYTTSLKIQEIGSGDQSGIWGTTTNTNWTLIEQAVAGVQTITMSNSDYTLTNLNGVLDEARNMVLVVNGANSAIRKVVAPQNQPKLYVISNQTTGGYAITIGSPSGSIITIPNGVTAQVYTDGTNFYSAQTGSAGDFTVNGNLIAAGVTVTGALSAASISVSGAAAFSTSPTMPTPSSSDNSTKGATTAYVTTAVTSATGSLGTMSTQNANSVAITGGTINGVTGTAAGLTVGNATNATTAANGGVTSVNGNTGAVTISTTPTGLGFGGTTWHNVTGGRSFNSQYQNNYSYPIAVSASTTCSSGSSIYAYVNGIQVSFFQWQFNGCGSFGGAFIIVPPGQTYQLNSGQGVSNWVELY